MCARGVTEVNAKRKVPYIHPSAKCCRLEQTTLSVTDKRTLLDKGFERVGVEVNGKLGRIEGQGGEQGAGEGWGGKKERGRGAGGCALEGSPK